MIRKGITPDKYTYVSLLRAFAEAQNVGVSNKSSNDRSEPALNASPHNPIFRRVAIRARDGTANPRLLLPLKSSRPCWMWVQPEWLKYVRLSLLTIDIRPFLRYIIYFIQVSSGMISDHKVVKGKRTKGQLMDIYDQEPPAIREALFTAAIMARARGTRYLPSQLLLLLNSLTPLARIAEQIWICR